MKMKGSQLACLVLLLVHESAGVYQTEWPSPDEVYALNNLLDGELFLPGVEGYTNSSYVVNQPMWSSKLGAVVYAQSVDDVKLALAFAREYKIRPTVRSSGHSYVGRSSGDGTLLINVERMNDIAVVLDDPESDTGASYLCEPGNNWRRVYEYVHQYGYVAVGGYRPSVATGGMIIGGAHGPLGRWLGLGVYGVLRVWVVLADGSYVNVTDPKAGESWIQHPDGSEGILDPQKAADLWWAIRGGGLSVGVIVKYKIKLFPAPEEITRVFLFCHTEHPIYGKSGEAILNNFAQFLVYNMTPTWNGYTRIDGGEYDLPLIGKAKGNITINLVHAGSYEEAVESIKPVYDFHPEYCQTRFIERYASYWDYMKDVPPDNWPRLFMTNRLVQREDFLDPEKWTGLMTKLIDDNLTSGELFRCLGRLTRGEHPDDPTDLVLNPNFRSALQVLNCALMWEDEKDDEHFYAVHKKWGETMYQVGKGVYFNEPDYFLEDWKTEFWGSMEAYEELLRIKNEFDPEHMFWCHMCVGSDTGPINHPNPDTKDEKLSRFHSGPGNLRNSSKQRII